MANHSSDRRLDSNRRVRLLRAIDTSEPLPMVLLMGTSWWTLLGWVSYLGDDKAIAWTLLLRHHAPQYWLALWTTLWVLRLMALLTGWRWLCANLNYLAIFNWCYAGWLLFHEPELTLASGMCVVMGLISLWCQVRSRKYYGSPPVNTFTEP